MELNKIYNEDCLQTMARMLDNFIDLVVTSPPYDKIRRYNGFSFDFHSIALELCRVLKKGGVIVWVVSDSMVNGSETGTSFRQALYFMERGLNLHDTMIYKKKNYLPKTHNRYEQEFEYMFVFSKGKPNTFNPIMIECKYAGSKNWGIRTTYKDDTGVLTKGEQSVVKSMKIKGNIFEYIVGSTKTGKVSHPAMFPNKLAQDQILTWSNAGELVYDCFMGSGTTAIEALKIGRSYIGSEISTEYCEIINQRLNSLAHSHENHQ